MPLEPGRIGQDRQAGRAAGLIGAGVIGWIKIFSYQSLGWRSLLYLCDQAEPARGGLAPKDGGEAAQRHRIYSTQRSKEGRRVGEECDGRSRERWRRGHTKKKKK